MCSSSRHICKLQRANGKVNLSGFKSIDTAVLNLIAHRHARTWTIRLDDPKEDTITIKFMDQPEAVDGVVEHRCTKLSANKGIEQKPVFVRLIVDAFSCGGVVSDSQSGPMYWFTVAPKFITMEETETLNSLSGGIVLGVDIVPHGVCIKYNMASDTRNNMRTLKKSDPGLFTRSLDAKSRHMCGKGIVSRRSHTTRGSPRTQKPPGWWDAIRHTLGV